MSELPIPGFRHAIKDAHGTRSRLLCRERLVEVFGDETVWQGEVLVFELLDHPTSHCCYAWEVDGEVTAVLHQGPVDSPQTAVRAAIMAKLDEGAQIEA
jgi:hypothetical protein